MKRGVPPDHDSGGRGGYPVAIMSKTSVLNGRRWRPAFDSLTFLVVLAGLGWFLVEGADTLHYNWQWYRIPRYFYTVDEGRLFAGPLIDGLIVNGSAKLVGWVSGVVRHLQTGYLYHYAFSMIVGLVLMLFWFVFMAPGAGA